VVRVTMELCILPHSVLTCSVRFLQLIPEFFRIIIKWLVFLTEKVFAACGVGMQILDKTERKISLKMFNFNSGYIYVVLYYTAAGIITPIGCVIQF